MNHTLRVDCRKISCYCPNIVANGQDADTITLDLDDEWSDLEKIVLVLGERNHAVKTVWTGEAVYVPSQLLDVPGYLPVSIVGYGADGLPRVTTARADSLLRVIPSGLVDGDDPYPEQPDVLSQLLDGIEDAEDAAERANEAAQWAEEAAKRAQDIADVKRATQVTVGEGMPQTSGIEGDSYIDSNSGNLWVFESTDATGK